MFNFYHVNIKTYYVKNAFPSNKENKTKNKKNLNNLAVRHTVAQGCPTLFGTFCKGHNVYCGPFRVPKLLCSFFAKYI